MDTRSKILRFLREFIAENGFPPTIREIASHLGFRSTKAVKVHLDIMAGEGLIRKVPGRARGIKPVERGLPVLGSVPAGQPVLRYENVEDWFDPFIWKDCFLLRVEGDSMIGAGIMDGDLVVVSPDTAPEPGEIVVARVEGEVTVKRLIKKEGKYLLKPENPDYQIIEGPFELVGRVVGVLRRFS